MLSKSIDSYPATKKISQPNAGLTYATKSELYGFFINLFLFSLIRLQDLISFSGF